jgi:hypothetical protein
MKTSDVVTASRRYGNHLGVEFGSVYKSTAVIPDGTSPPEVADTYSDYEQSATPGCRAPHVWLGSGGPRLSTLDLFGASFTVLTGAEATAWERGASAARERYGVPIATYAIGDPGLEDAGDAFFQRYGIDGSGAVLVRPDGYVAWRSAGAAEGDGEALSEAIGRVLGRA